MTGITTIFFIVFSIGCTSGITDLGDKQARLMYMLLKTYPAGIIPQYDDKIPLNCSMSLHPIRLLDANFEKEEIEMLFWMEMMWNDYRLTWDPNAASNISQLTIQKDNIWRPDIVVFTGLTELVSLSGIGDQVVVFSSGTVVYVPPVKIRAFCKKAETQCGDKGEVHEMTCNIKLGSWVRSGFEMDLYPNPKDFLEAEEFSHPSEYSVTFSNPTREKLYYPCCPEPYVSNTFPVRVSHAHKRK